MEQPEKSKGTHDDFTGNTDCNISAASDTPVTYKGKWHLKWEKAKCCLQSPKTRSAKRVQQCFRTTCGNEQPIANLIRCWYRKFVNEGCICKSTGWLHISTETVDHIF